MHEYTHGLRLDPFFGFRTPLLPLADWQAWNEGLTAVEDPTGGERFTQAYVGDCQLLRERLRALIARPEVIEGLMVASPDLVDSLPRWIQDPESEKGQRSEQALVRYFARMCHRSTPFGLFAAHAMGRMGPETRLEVGLLDQCWRHSRLDMSYLCDLTAELQKDAGLREKLVFRANNSIYRIGDRYRYAFVQMKHGHRDHQMVVVHPDEALEAVLACAKDGADLLHLARTLHAADLPLEEVQRYLGELIDQQILVSNLEPATTGPEPLQELIRICASATTTLSIAHTLGKAAQILETIDTMVLGNSRELYHELVRTLQELPVRLDRSKLWQVDFFRPGCQVTLGPSFQEEIRQAMGLIHRLTPVVDQDPLRAFKEAFRQRYDQRWVPLSEALDPECGVGRFGASGNVTLAAPLLDGLVLKSRKLAAGPEPGLLPREEYLLRRLLEVRSTGGQTLELSEADVTALTDSAPSVPMPCSFSCLVELAGNSPNALETGEYKILIHGAGGPSSARMFGRFCHGDPALLAEVGRHLEKEERLSPHAIFAEIAHLPQGRIGNVLARPVLRGFELPYLGRSGAQPHQWIGLDDLYVGLLGERVVLWSRRLNREIRPRLSSAAAYQDRGTDVYRFLASLQDQGVQCSLGFTWGSLGREAMLPRVVYGKLVLARARWLWSQSELMGIRKAEGAQGRFLAMQRLRQEKKLPRHLLLADGDNELPVDLNNALGLEALWGAIKHRNIVVLVEDFPGGEHLVAKGAEGAFTHQLVLSFLAEPEQPEPAPPPPILTEPQVLHIPGSEWLFAKLYMGLHTTETLLGGLLGEWVRGALAAGDADRWYFIRYSDPEPHLRLRFHGEPGRIWGRLLPGLKQVLHPFMLSGLVWRFQLDTYEPETIRYGGLANLERAERIFMADSEAALNILATHAGEKGLQERWQLALVSVDEFYATAGFDVATRLQLARTQCQGFDQEYAPGHPSVNPQLGDRFRAERKRLATLLDPAMRLGDPVAQGIATLRERTKRLRPLFIEIEQLDAEVGLTTSLEAMLGSFIHMSVNRLLSSAQREQEMVIYHFLVRLYESRIAQTRQNAPPGHSVISH